MVDHFSRGAAASELEARPLAGLRVLDVSRLLPGPYAAMALADLGAEVDKIEDGGGDDYLRFMPPHVSTGQNALFEMLNRGKRSIVLDLKKEPARAAFRKLIPRYDVLIESFRPGVMAKLGLGYEQLAAIHPGLVYCAITGYGQTGPLAHRAGHDIDYLARAGVLGLTGPEDGAPQVAGVQMADIGGGAAYALVGILAALSARGITGRGRMVDVSMCEGSASFAAFGLMSAWGGLSFTNGTGPLSGGIAPFQTYLTKDGRSVALGALEPKFWIAFATAVGLEPDMTALAPGEHQKEWKAKVAAVFAGKTLAEWIAFAEKVDCCLEPVLTPDEVARDPQHRARGFVVDVALRDGTTLPQLKTPTAAHVAGGFAPRQGEHTAEVLRECGMSDEEIAALG
jgi:crotonobetainyl-CoA:carnitine CoA-transferase CaiB-like acyl-CoA transferase